MAIVITAGDSAIGAMIRPMLVYGEGQTTMMTSAPDPLLSGL